MTGLTPSNRFAIHSELFWQLTHAQICLKWQNQKGTGLRGYLSTIHWNQTWKYMLSWISSLWSSTPARAIWNWTQVNTFSDHFLNWGVSWNTVVAYGNWKPKCVVSNLSCVFLHTDPGTVYAAPAYESYELINLYSFVFGLFCYTQRTKHDNILKPRLQGEF